MNTGIKFIGKIDSHDWSHYLWNITINGETFEYKTGLGCTENNKSYGDRKKFITHEKSLVTIPTIDEILHAIFLDYDTAKDSFDEFCENCGYSNDSIKALNIYQACSNNGKKLRKALGQTFESELKRIQALEL